MNKLFIAGASGNIGKELTSFLLKKKEYELHCAYYKSKISKKKIKNFFTYKINLIKKSSIKKLIQINPDIIINLAAFTDPSKNELYPKKSFEKNVIVNRNILDYCSLYKKKLIFTSTDKVYGGNIKRPTEKQDLKPDNLYGINKLKCENEIKKKLKQYLILRYASVYSNKITNKIFINRMINKIKKKNNVYLATNVHRLFVSTEYLSKIIYELIKKKSIGTFNIGSDATNYYNLVRLICIKKKITIRNFLNKTKIKTSPQYLIPCQKKLVTYLRSVKYV